MTGKCHQRVPVVWALLCPRCCFLLPSTLSKLQQGTQGFLCDTTPFNPGYCHRSCRISCFLPGPSSKGDMQKTPQAHLCCQGLRQQIPAHREKSEFYLAGTKRDRTTLFISYFLLSKPGALAAACSPLPYRESRSSREHRAGMFYLSLLRHGWKIPSRECLRCQCLHLCLQAMHWALPSPLNLHPTAPKAPARRASSRLHTHGHSSDPK